MFGCVSFLIIIDKQPFSQLIIISISNVFNNSMAKLNVYLNSNLSNSSLRSRFISCHVVSFSLDNLPFISMVCILIHKHINLSRGFHQCQSFDSFCTPLAFFISQFYVALFLINVIIHSIVYTIVCLPCFFIISFLSPLHPLFRMDPHSISILGSTLSNHRFD